MKFAHIADCHLGGWRDIRLQNANTRSFQTAIQTCIDEQVDFVLICGDMFNTAIPPIDVIRVATKELKRLKDKGIRTYVIAGSHDYSPSGKTILDVLESAGLFVNTSKGEATPEGKLKLKITEDSSGVKLCGVLGKRGGLDKAFYEEIDRKALEIEGDKIFMFHGTLAELKPSDLKSDDMAVSLLPTGFNYYAGGHVHIVKNQNIEGYNIVYPGPTFPNNFAELEKLQGGNMVIVDNWEIRNIPIKLHNLITIKINGQNKKPAEVEMDLLQRLTHEKVQNAIILIRAEGTMTGGKVTDIQWDSIIQNTLKRGAYACLKNIAALGTPDVKPIQTVQKSTEEIEEQLVNEKLQHKTIGKELMLALNTEKQEGETQVTFERRIEQELDKVYEGFTGH
jgi:DNA repair exonuclease SbcCD nuclease subunit